MACSPCQDAPWRRLDWLAAGLLVLTVVVLHGRALYHGFFLDDNYHLELCRENGYTGLISSNKFEYNRRILRVWWAARETGLAYFRPLPVALRTTWLGLFGLNPMPYHAIHLLLYLVVVLLFYGLLRRCSLGTGAALLAALFFCIHPSHAQITHFLFTDYLILATLASVSALWLMHASAAANHRRPGLLAGVFACYALALLSGETGLMLGPILVLFDWLQAGPGPQPRPWRLYCALALQGLFYLGLRTLCLEKSPLPPYFYLPTDPAFASWFPYKLLTDLYSLPLGCSSSSIVDVPWLQAHPVGTGLAIAMVLVVGVVFLVPQRRSRVVWGILAGMALVAAPTILCWSFSYRNFPLSAGWSVVLALWAVRLWPNRPRLVGVGLVSVAVLYLVGTWSNDWQVWAMADAEHCVRDEVLAANPASYSPGTHLFILDLPFLASEVGPALRLHTGRTDLEVFALTYAPEPFAPRRIADIRQMDERTLLVRVDGDGWFAGTFGENVQLGWFGGSHANLPVGPVTLHPSAGQLPFRVEVVERGPDGIRALRFIFDKPLDDPSYRFFVCSQRRLAQPWRPNGNPPTPGPEPHLALAYRRMQRMQSALEHVNRVLARCP